MIDDDASTFREAIQPSHQRQIMRREFGGPGGSGPPLYGQCPAGVIAGGEGGVPSQSWATIAITRRFCLRPASVALLCNGPGEAVAPGVEAGGIDPEAVDEIGLHALGPPEGEVHVVSRGADVACVALDQGGGVRIGRHEFGDLLDPGVVDRFDVGLVAVELDLQVDGPGGLGRRGRGGGRRNHRRGFRGRRRFPGAAELEAHPQGGDEVVVGILGGEDVPGIRPEGDGLGQVEFDPPAVIEHEIGVVMGIIVFRPARRFRCRRPGRGPAAFPAGSGKGRPGGEHRHPDHPPGRCR